MKIKLLLYIVFLVFSLISISCNNNIREENSLEYEIKEIVVDESKINSNDIFTIIEPLWWSVNIYAGEKKYLEDLGKFSEPQKLVFAIEWYLAEVNNGGHDQFYFNSTGIVWEEALRGFEVIGLLDNYEILKESTIRLGGYPSKERNDRQEQLDKYEPQFDDLDERLYKSEKKIEEALLKYIRENKQDFLFKENVKVPK